MANWNHPLAATAVAVALSLTVTGTGAAQAAPAAPTETRFVLVGVGGKALPVEIEKEWRCREDVTAGTLRLREDGFWRLETSVRETCGDRTEMEHEDEDGRYRTEGTTLHFLDDDGERNRADWSLRDEIDLDELDQGTISDGGVLTVRLADAKTVLRFQREGA
jgi:hypothetical protein